jgi:exodeoxyribonuclease-3
MKLVSWNVNGIRACVGKDFMESFRTLDADIFCLQETKLQEGQIELDLPGYHQYWNYAEKKGYSGTAVFTRREPLSVRLGIGQDAFDHEGRVITLEFPEFYFLTVYTPNSQDGLLRLPYRMEWEDAFLAYIRKLDSEKPVIFCDRPMESEGEEGVVRGMNETCPQSPIQIAGWRVPMKPRSCASISL